MTSSTKEYRNPPTAVDLVIEVYDRPGGSFQGLVFIERGNTPYKGCKALPGGFQEIGESLEETAMREGLEEITLELEVLAQLPIYSAPDRDPRGHVNSVGFICRGYGLPRADDDARNAKVYPLDSIPRPLAFDHEKRIPEYLLWRAEQERKHHKR